MAIIQNLEAFVQSYPAGLDSVTDLQLSQNENGRQIRFTIGGVTIPAGSVATISGTKPDGVVYSNTGTIEGADTVIFDEDVQMTAVFGTWYAKIRITNAGNTIASARVRFIIDKDPVDAGAIPSESQLNGLVAEAEEYAGAAEDAAERAAITYGSPLTAATAAAMTDVNRVYVYTGSESGYTYGNWYYYNGSAWVSGGVYNSAAVETDTTLTESGVPADAKATGDKIAELKDDLSRNLFDPIYLLKNCSWTKNANEYYGTAFNANRTYGSSSSPYPVTGIEANTRYTLSFDAYTDGNIGTSGNGIKIVVGYTDNTDTRAAISNSVTSYTHFSITTDANKSVSGIWFGYGLSGNNVWHLKNIQLEKGTTETTYIPHIYAIDSKAREELSEVGSDIGNISDSIANIVKNLPYASSEVITPSGFTWSNHPLVGKIFTDYKGHYSIDFDVSEYEPTEGTIYYVDVNNGQESNDGLTPSTALRKMATAYNKSDCVCIMVADGIYNQNANLSAVTISKDISIKAMNGAKPIICTDSGSTFTQYSGATYSATRGSIARVIDISASNKNGDFYEYTKLESASDVVNTSGSWAHISRTLYVHCLDDRVPDNNLLLTIAANNIYVEGNPTIYLEGLTIVSGYSPLKVSNTSQATNPKVFAKNCKFLYSESTSNDIVMLQGAELSIMQNCIARYGQKDGFNYHAQNNVIPKAIEINCIGAFCGNDSDSNDQGSTIHDGGSAIRINCTYNDNYGSNIADEAAESWNIGCVAFAPQAPNSGQRGNFYAYTDTKMWIDSCVMFGNAHYNIISATDNTTAIYLRNNIFDNADKNTPIYGVTPTYY